MNPSDIKEQWELDKEIFKAWGDYVIKKITDELECREKNLEIFLKIPVRCRLKDSESLIEKAFYRNDKDYSDPYNEIEDKAGVRFVVLFVEDIEEICEIIENNDDWSFDKCKHFEQDRQDKPLLFSYQSVHYILKPKKEITTCESIKITTSTTCEVQIRTLLQHAHAELTHSATYKKKSEVKPEPEIERTIAKSMALIETTDDFFQKVDKELNHKFDSIDKELDKLYLEFTGLKPQNKKMTSIIYREFGEILNEKNEKLVSDIREFVDQKKEVLKKAITEKYNGDGSNYEITYRQSVILFIYWMICKKPRLLSEKWPLNKKILSSPAKDLGVSEDILQ